MSDDPLRVGKYSSKEHKKKKQQSLHARILLPGLQTEASSNTSDVLSGRGGKVKWQDYRKMQTLTLVTHKGSPQLKLRRLG